MNRFQLVVDGRTITAEPGQTVAAAMVAAGVTVFGTTRFTTRTRGMFCGIGVCFECLVTVNGRPGVRACLEPAGPGDVITTGRGH